MFRSPSGANDERADFIVDSVDLWRVRATFRKSPVNGSTENRQEWLRKNPEINTIRLVEIHTTDTLSYKDKQLIMIDGISS